MKKLFTLALGVLAFSQVDAQVRYINEVFSDVEVTTNVVYGQNVTVLPLLQSQPPATQPLVCDIYEPAGDTETNRPLMIYIHTGNFLPQYLNGSAVGTKTTRWLLNCVRGTPNWATLWLPSIIAWDGIHSRRLQKERTFQLINAAYRGVQDARTAVRYFRMTEATMSNPYGIDPDKIGYLGEEPVAT